jgi:hypothetical protein
MSHGKQLVESRLESFLQQSPVCHAILLLSNTVDLCKSKQDQSNGKVYDVNSVFKTKP